MKKKSTTTIINKSQCINKSWVANPFIFTFLLLTSLLTGCSSGSEGGSDPVYNAEPIETTREGSGTGPTEDVDPEGSGPGPIDPGMEGSGTGPLDPVDPEGSGTGPIDAQVILGPVIGADVEVFNAYDLDNVLCRSKTEISEDLELAGTFKLEDGCVEKDGLYLLIVAGGFDIDIDDDGILNVDDDDDGELTDKELETASRLELEINERALRNEPIPVEGKLRVLVTGNQMMSGEWKISALTEYVFQAMQFDIKRGASIDTILEAMDRIAPLMVKVDIDESGSIDSTDLILWSPGNPAHGKTSLTDQQMRDFIYLIHRGRNQTNKKVIPYPGLIKHVDTLSAAKTVTVKGDIAYVTTANAVQLIDIKKPKQAKIIGWFPTGAIREMLVGDDRVFIALEGNILQIIDTSDPEKPTLLQSIENMDVRKLYLRNTDLLVISYDDEKLEPGHYLNVFSSERDYEDRSDTLINSGFAIDYHAEIDTSRFWDYYRKNYYGFMAVGDAVYAALPNGYFYKFRFPSVLQPVFIESESLSRLWLDPSLSEGLDSFGYSEIVQNKILVSGGGGGAWIFREGESVEGVLIPEVFEDSIPAWCSPDFGHQPLSKFIKTDSFLIIPCIHKNSLYNSYRTVGFSYWSPDTLEYLGDSKVLAFQGIKPGFVPLFPERGKGVSSEGVDVISGAEDDIIDEDSKPVFSLENAKHNLNLLTLWKEYLAYSIWGEITIEDMTREGNIGYYALGEHGFHIVELESLAEEGRFAEGSVSLEDVGIDVSANIYKVWEGAESFAKGGVADAIIEIRHQSGIDEDPLCTVRSENTPNLGRIRIPRTCLKTEGSYVLSVTGGVYDDRSIDGQLNGIFERRELLYGGWQINLYTDYVYQRMLDRLKYSTSTKSFNYEAAKEGFRLEPLSEEVWSLMREVIVSGESDFSGISLLPYDDSVLFSDAVRTNSFSIVDEWLVTAASLYGLSDFSKVWSFPESMPIDSVVGESVFFDDDIFVEYTYSVNAWDTLTFDSFKKRFIKIDVRDRDNIDYEILTSDVKLHEILGVDSEKLCVSSRSSFFEYDGLLDEKIQLSNESVYNFSALSNVAFLAKGNGKLVGWREQIDTGLYPETDGQDYDYFSYGSDDTERQSLGAFFSGEENWADIDKSPVAKYGLDIQEGDKEFSPFGARLANILHYTYSEPLASYSEENDDGVYSKIELENDLLADVDNPNYIPFHVNYFVPLQGVTADLPEEYVSRDMVLYDLSNFSTESEPIVIPTERTIEITHKTQVLLSEGTLLLWPAVKNENQDVMSGRLELYEITDGLEITAIGTYELMEGVDFKFSYNAALVGQRLVVLCDSNAREGYFDGLCIYELSYDESVVLEKYFPLGSSNLVDVKLVVERGKAYIGGGTGMVTVDVSEYLPTLH